jgi:hypothetical protein
MKGRDQLNIAIAAFTRRFERQLVSRWDNLESQAGMASVNATSEDKASLLGRFFDDAANAMSGVIHEYFPKLLCIATNQREHLENRLPLEWTDDKIMTQVCNFLGIERKFDETSAPSEYSRVLRAAARITAGVGYLDEAVPIDFVLPRWVDARESLRFALGSEPKGLLSRTDTLNWVKLTEFGIRREMDRSIENETLDSIIEVQVVLADLNSTTTGVTPAAHIEAGDLALDASRPATECTSLTGVHSGREEQLASRGLPAITPGVSRAKRVETIRREMGEITRMLELDEDYDARIRHNDAFADYVTVSVCNRHPDLRDKLCAIAGTHKPKIVEIACEIASRVSNGSEAKPLLPRTYHDAQKRYGSQARKLLGLC